MRKQEPNIVSYGEAKAREGIAYCSKLSGNSCPIWWKEFPNGKYKVNSNNRFDDHLSGLHKLLLTEGVRLSRSTSFGGSNLGE